MTYTPFEREMLKKAERTNKLLELLVMAHQPMKLMTGVLTDGPGADALQEVEGHYTQMSKAHAEAMKDVTMPIEQAFAAAGIVPMGRRPGSGQPETPEQRAERFAARAKEVGLPDEQIAEVSGRVQLNLDTLAPEPGIVGVGLDADRNVVKKSPAKKAARPAK